MFKKLLIALILSLCIVSPAFAARSTVTGTISLLTANPTYQEKVFFDTTVTGKLKGYEYPMVLVACYQEVKVYAQLDYPYAGFILGSGSSLWVSRGGGEAECTASLMIYPGLHSGPIYTLDTINFHANG